MKPKMKVLTIRVTCELHGVIRRVAWERKQSMNQMATDILAEALGFAPEPQHDQPESILDSRVD